MGLKMKRHPSEAQAKEEFEDEAAEAAESCKMLMDVDEERVKKTSAGFKQHTPHVQPSQKVKALC